MRNIERVLLGLIGVVAVAGMAPGGFGAGNLVVVRVGDGSTAVEKGSAAAVFLDEIDPATGAVVRSVALPTESSGARRRLTLSSSATSEGALATSGDGRYLTLAGYDAPPLMAKVTSSPSEEVPRVVARVDASGRVDTSTTIVDGYSRNNVRAAVTVDGRRFYLAGAGVGGGTRVVEFGGEGASRLLTSKQENTRGVAIFEGQLYASMASGEVKGIVAIGRGIPAEDGRASILVAPSPTATDPKPVDAGPGPSAAPDPKPTGFVFLDRRLYVADLESGLLVYEADGAGEGGLARYRLSSKHGPPNLAGLAGRLVEGKPVLYGTDGERLLQFTIGGPEVAIREVARAGPNRAFRGVAFAPTVLDATIVPLPVLVALGAIGLSLPGGLILALRRKARRRVRFEGTDILVDGGPTG